MTLESMPSNNESNKYSYDSLYEKLLNHYLPSDNDDGFYDSNFDQSYIQSAQENAPELFKQVMKDIMTRVIFPFALLKQQVNPQVFRETLESITPLLEKDERLIYQLIAFALYSVQINKYSCPNTKIATNYLDTRFRSILENLSENHEKYQPYVEELLSEDLNDFVSDVETIFQHKESETGLENSALDTIYEDKEFSISLELQQENPVIKHRSIVRMHLFGFFSNKTMTNIEDAIDYGFSSEGLLESDLRKNITTEELVTMSRFSKNYKKVLQLYSTEIGNIFENTYEQTEPEYPDITENIQELRSYLISQHISPKFDYNNPEFLKLILKDIHQFYESKNNLDYAKYDN